MIEQRTALMLDPKDIARAELARWRRRLGPLTSEQEEKIESVLMSIAIRTSQLATNVMDSLLSAKVSDVASHKKRESATGAADGASISFHSPQPKEARI